jgi:hypothetical protein
MSAEEVWRPVPYDHNYLISDHGNVWSIRSRIALKLTTHPQCGHVYVRFSRHSKGRMFKVHRLVAEVFICPQPGPGYEVCHNDGNASNNHVSNLRWDTRSANVLDQVRHGTHVQARKTHCPRLHPYDEANTYVNRQGKRECRACHRESQARRRARRRQEAAA